MTKNCYCPLWYLEELTGHLVYLEELTCHIVYLEEQACPCVFGRTVLLPGLFGKNCHVTWCIWKNKHNALFGRRSIMPCLFGRTSMLPGVFGRTAGSRTASWSPCLSADWTWWLPRLRRTPVQALYCHSHWVQQGPAKCVHCPQTP